jgi:DNA-binding NarL/FixJ family response regulator
VEALVALARCHLLRRDTTAAGRSLRLAHELGGQMEAEPLLSEVEALARSARISLVHPASPAPLRSAGGSVLAQLTARENEILGYLVAGHTYREIAEELVISEKTVSVHVSNLLRKTGTSSRVEVSELARQAASEGWGPDI